jgi:hypothetical protein
VDIVQRKLLGPVGALSASLFFALTGAAFAGAAPAPSPTPPQIVRTSNAWFLAGAPPASYRFAIYATGVDRNAVIAFDRDTLVPIENGASIDVGDDNVALPADQHYLRVTLPAKFRDKVGKVAVQISQDGRLSAIVYVHVESNLAVP